MTHPTTAQAEGSCPVTTVLELANKTAKAELGTAATGKRVCATASLTVAVTEGGKTKTTSVDAGVTLGVKVSETDAPASDCEDCCK